VTHKHNTQKRMDLMKVTLTLHVVNYFMDVKRSRGGNFVDSCP
jgi:hypothetical protein